MYQISRYNKHNHKKLRKYRIITGTALRVHFPRTNTKSDFYSTYFPILILFRALLEVFSFFLFLFGKLKFSTGFFIGNLMPTYTTVGK